MALKGAIENSAFTTSLTLIIVGVLCILASFTSEISTKGWHTTKEVRLIPCILGGIMILLSVFIQIWDKFPRPRQKPFPKNQEDKPQDNRKTDRNMDISKLPIDRRGLDSSCQRTSNYENKVRYFQFNYVSCVDGEGNFFAICRRTGKAIDELDKLIVRDLASGEPKANELSFLAYDLKNLEPLECTPLNDDAQLPGTKLFSISLIKQLKKGDDFTILFFFKWPKCMAPNTDYDYVAWPDLPEHSNYAPSIVEHKLFLPTNKAKFQVGVMVPGNKESVELINKTNMVLGEEIIKSDDNHCSCSTVTYYPIDLQEDQGIAQIYQTNSWNKDIKLSNYVNITFAQQEDLKFISTIEKGIEKNEHPATLENLQQRLSIFPEGFIVCKIGGQIIGYTQACKISTELYENMETFAEISDFSTTHDESSETMYIIFVGVVNTFRHQGIAKKMLNFLIERASLSNSIKNIALVSTLETQRFYKEILGFKESRELSQFIPNSQSKTFLMHKVL